MLDRQAVVALTTRVLALLISLTLLAINASAAAAEPQPVVEVAPGVLMPIVNMGTCCGSDIKTNLPIWVAQGGVGVDTALDYGSDKPGADADRIAIGGLQNEMKAVLAVTPRSKLFITSKVPAGFSVRSACSILVSGSRATIPSEALEELAYQQVLQDLREMGVEQADLILLHAPCRRRIDSVRMWRGLERALGEGLVRAIGVSNFDVADFDYFLPRISVPPALNQCEMSLKYHNDTVIDYCKQHGITYQAWGVLTGCPLDDPLANAMAAARGVDVSSLCMRWVIDRGAILAVGLGSHESRLASHAQSMLAAVAMSPLSASEMRDLEGIYAGVSSPPRFPMRRSTIVDE